MTTITLVMIVKNESAILARCLDSVRSIVDYFVLTDTGSTDGTPDIIKSYLATHNLVGTVCNDEWQNFGHNRTKSVENAKNWLQSQNIPLATNYILTLDADMLGVVGDDSLKDCLDRSDMWLVQQHNPCIQYENIRFFRSSLSYQSVGVTHEFWKCLSTCREGRIPPRQFSIDDRGDGGCKSDKFERDIRLLRKGLIDEPTNVRYFFYLAQSYADSGKTEDALKWYQRRIDAGGWKEEIFISHKRRGDLYRMLGKMELAVSEWLMGWEKMPNRSETLYEVVRHYRLIGQYYTAFLFLEKALLIPLPNDSVLFVEFPIYRYKLLEELSIIAFYVNKKREGLIASQYLLLNKEIPIDVKRLVENNLFFYIEPLSYEKSGKISVPSYRTGSASLLSIKPVTGMIRSVNYHITDSFEFRVENPDGIVRTTNLWVDGDTVYPVSYDLAPVRNSHVKGLEDIRLCRVNGEQYGIASSWEYGRCNCPSVVLIHFTMTEGRWQIDRYAPIRYRDDICQKNWTLYEENGKLYAVYSHSPLVILALSTEPETFADFRVVREAESYAIDVRGSANMVWAKGERLFLVHHILIKETRRYYHRLLRYSSDWVLTGVSEPFYIKTFFVEFSLSMLYDEDTDELTIPFSTRDQTTEWVSLQYSSVKWLENCVKADSIL